MVIANATSPGFIGGGFRADLIVGDRVIVEIEPVEVLAPVQRKQLMTCLRLADKRIGLLINFNAALLKSGITRIVNRLEEDLTQSPKGPRTPLKPRGSTSCRFEVEDLPRDCMR